MGFLGSIYDSIINFSENARKAREEQLRLGLEKITDSMAKEIEWTPLERGGSGFVTHQLNINMNGNLEFQSSKFSIIIPGVMIGMALLFDLGIFIGFLQTFDYSLMIALFPPTIFMIIGYFLYKHLSRGIVFDRQSGYFYKGKPQLSYGLIDPNNKNMTPLSNIHAIQIIGEKVSTKHSSFSSYEINLVLHDKSRVNVVDHSNLPIIKEDARKLSEYLGIPLWDISEVVN